MRFLELFSGLKSVGKVAEKLGFEVIQSLRAFCRPILDDWMIACEDDLGLMSGVKYGSSIPVGAIKAN